MADQNATPAAFEDEQVVGPSPRSVGLTFGVVFTIAGLVPLATGGTPRVWALTTAALFALVAVAAPALLGPLSRAWLRLGLAMHRVVNPLVMAVLFYAAVTPFGLVMRLFGRGLGPRLRQERSASSYWVTRETPFSAMNQQF